MSPTYFSKYSPQIHNPNKMVKILAIVAFVGLVVSGAHGHGRFMKPPSRSSIWRIPEFEHLNPPINYDDNQLYCGGIHQEDDPGSNCGVCGDPFDQPSPRDNEYGGMYDAGIIVAEYQSGATIQVEVDLTTSHLGHMEFRLCTDPTSTDQSCFDQHVLKMPNGETKLEAGPTGMMYAEYVLPEGVTCDRCVIQWNYRAGNGWGECEDGTWETGCGPQETFRGCADVKIV